MSQESESYHRLLHLENENKALREMLAESLFYAGKEYDRQGYCFTTSYETSFRDINYRDARLYPTAEECIDAELKIWMEERV